MDIRYIILPVLTIVMLSSCSSSLYSNSQNQIDPSVAEMDSELGPGDVFDIRVYDEENLSGSYRVAADGTIDFPLIGTIRVQKLTPPRVAELLKKRLIKEEYIRDPQVSVFVKEYRSKNIKVFGQVRRPGTFTYEDGMTVVQAITLAGGFTSIANKNKTTLSRTVNGKTERIRVHVEDIGEGKIQDMVVRAGDNIFVPERIF